MARHTYVSGLRSSERGQLSSNVSVSNTLGKVAA